MNRKILALVMVFTLLSSAFIVGGCGGGAKKAEEPGKVVKLKFGHVLASEHPYHLGAIKFAELVKQKTQGRIEISVFPNSQIGNERDMIEGLQFGAVDLTLVSTAPLAGFTKKFLVFDLPYIFVDRKHAYAVLDGKIGEDLLKTLENNRIVGLGYWENGFRHLYNSKKPLINPEDVKGLKIRTMENKIHMALFKTLGGDPTPMAWGEVFTALQQKVVDGAEAPLPALYTSKHYEVQKHLSMTSHLYAPAVLLMSQKAYNGLPDADRKTVKQAALEARDYERELIRKADEELIIKLKDKGMEIKNIDVAKWKQAAQPVYKEFEKEIGADIIEAVGKLQK